MNRPGETLLAFIERTILRRRPRPPVEERPSLAPWEPSYVLSPYRVAYPRPPEPEPAEEPSGPNNVAFLKVVNSLHRLLADSGLSSEEAARAFSQMNRPKDP